MNAANPIEQTINDEATLERLLKNDIDGTDKPVKVLAGHLPLIYHNETRTVELGTRRWGNFSEYTWDLGCKILQYAHSKGKEGKLLLVVDDEAELMERHGCSTKVVRKDWHHPVRRALFLANTLPMNYLQILAKHGLSIDNIARQPRDSEHNTVLISEIVLKREANNQGLAAFNACALAFNGILATPEIYTSADYLITLIPGQCKGNICTGVLKETHFDGSHVFFPHVSQLGGLNNGVQIKSPWTVEQMYSWGVNYLRDTEASK